MRNSKTNGFTLIELLIVIAIIGILAAVLIPNLLNARARAFDTAAQTCLKEVVTAEEINASVDPWQYQNDLAGVDDAAGVNANGITSCNGVDVVVVAAAADANNGAIAANTLGSDFHYRAAHENGSIVYDVVDGSGVVSAPAAVDFDTFIAAQ